MCTPAAPTPVLPERTLVTILYTAPNMAIMLSYRCDVWRLPAVLSSLQTFLSKSADIMAIPENKIFLKPHGPGCSTLSHGGDTAPTRMRRAPWPVTDTGRSVTRTRARHRAVCPSRRALCRTTHLARLAGLSGLGPVPRGSCPMRQTRLPGHADESGGPAQGGVRGGRNGAGGRAE